MDAHGVLEDFMDIFSVLTMIGGLALFLYGMQTMSGALGKMAGGKLEDFFDRVTSNRFKAVALGTGVTALIQSSAATTVMLIGFVNAGIMQLRQTIGVLMGADIGTTITAWLLSLSGVEGESVVIQLFKPTSFSPILAIIGVILIMSAKSDKKKTIGEIMIGFAILMFGMNMMQTASETLKDSETFTSVLLLFKNPLLGVLIGAVITAILQSSSVSIGILQALSSTGRLTFGISIPIIIGQNIGSCINGIISSIGTSKNAKRVAAVHLSIKLIGAVLFLSVFYTLNAILDFAFMDLPISETYIAIFHTIYNVGVTIVLLPFTNALEKLAYVIVKDKKTDEDEEERQSSNELKQLEERFLRTPTVAVERARTVVCSMTHITRRMVKHSCEILFSYDEEKYKELLKHEKLVKEYERAVESYLIKISSLTLSEKDAKMLSTLLYNISELERIASHARSIAISARTKHKSNDDFSKKARDELNVMCSAVQQVMEFAVTAVCDMDLYAAYEIEPLEEVVDQLRTKIKNRHVKRLQAGKCTIDLGFVFNDILTSLERMSDHCSNIAICMVQVNDDNFENNEYMRTISTSGAEFDGEVAKFQKQFPLPKKEDYKKK